MARARTSSRQVGAGRLLVALAVLAAPAAKAAPQREVRSAAETAGPWMLALDGTPRRCRVMLGVEPAGAGQAVRFPAGCRRALPVLNGVAGWAVEDGAVTLLGADGQPLLRFTGEADAEGAVRARTASGESYVLAVETAENGFDAPPRVMTAALTPAPVFEPSLPRHSTGIAGPGVYTLDRFVEKDTCRIELAPGPEGLRAVRLLDGCRDSGLAVFDPVGWRFEDGRLTLVARKGHTVGLIGLGDGRWRRDPEVGTTFVLRRVD